MNQNTQTRVGRRAGGGDGDSCDLGHRPAQSDAAGMGVTSRKELWGPIGRGQGSRRPIEAGGAGLGADTGFPEGGAGASVSQAGSAAGDAESRRLTRAGRCRAVRPRWSSSWGTRSARRWGSASVRPPRRRPKAWAVLRASLRGGAQSSAPARPPLSQRAPCPGPARRSRPRRGAGGRARSWGGCRGRGPPCRLTTGARPGSLAADSLRDLVRVAALSGLEFRLSEAGS